MTHPPLADRLRAFEKVLEAEPCTGPPGVPDDTPNKIGGCINAEAYEGGPGSIPRR
jgi:hypothetical protein